MTDADAPRVRRGKRNASYTAISNSLIDHPTLSPEARLVLIYLLSKPDDWRLQPGDIRRFLGTGESRCGRNKAYEVIKELKDTAYVSVVKEIDDQGQFNGVTYYIFDEPTYDNTPGDWNDRAPGVGYLRDSAKTGKSDLEPPRPEIGDTVLSPCPLLRDPVKGDLTKDRQKQITEPPPPSPSDVDAFDETHHAMFADLWEHWPAETRPRERQLAESLFNRLPHNEQLQAVQLCGSHLKSMKHQGRYAAMIPYLRNREYLSFIDAPEFTSDGYFRILPHSTEWKAWMAHLAKTISAKTLAKQDELGYMLVRTRLPEIAAAPSSDAAREHRGNGSARILNDHSGPQDGELTAVLSRLTAKFSNVRPKRARAKPAVSAPQRNVAPGV